jgi:hypothetical protein
MCLLILDDLAYANNTNALSGVLRSAVTGSKRSQTILFICIHVIHVVNGLIIDGAMPTT